MFSSLQWTWSGLLSRKKYFLAVVFFWCFLFCFCFLFFYFLVLVTAWKVSVFGVFWSVSSRIQTQYLSKEYLSVFMLNSGIYETEEVRIRVSIYLSIDLTIYNIYNIYYIINVYYIYIYIYIYLTKRLSLRAQFLKCCARTHPVVYNVYPVRIFFSLFFDLCILVATLYTVKNKLWRSCNYFLPTGNRIVLPRTVM